ncbi:hypothetical protein ACJ41O_000354 [Fusarium nematophilum]
MADQPPPAPSEKTAPIVPIEIPASFQFGPAAPRPHAETIPFGILEKFNGTFIGFGFNTIFRPSSNKTPPHFHKTPQRKDNPDNVLELNLTNETMVFSNRLGVVPNRGGGDQPDMNLDGVPYTQTILDATQQAKPGKKQPVIHFEPGLWMRVPPSTVPALPASFARMASIPHGTTINAQCFQPAVTAKGPPSIPSVSITPLILPDGPVINPPFPSQTAASDDTRRIPQQLGRFIKAGTITQAMLDNPNIVLSDANSGKNIIDNTSFTVSTVDPKTPVEEFGGGTSNIGFLVGADAGAATITSQTGNATAVKVTAQYWISTVQASIVLEPSTKTVSPVPSGPRDAVPSFLVDFDVTVQKTVTVQYTQIQYTQEVDLDFNGLRWPHVTVATLAPSGQALSSVLVS